ncbi:MAG: hypothetical protein EB003_05260, partial [Flavobacteriia bacterium]|nr:hypothetical protein [Flavobacteriia bacterium]
MESESRLPENRELKNTTTRNPSIDKSNDTVEAQQQRSSGKSTSQPPRPIPVAPIDDQITVEQIITLEAKSITPARVAANCPVMAGMVGPDPRWTDLAAAAKTLAAHYGISHRTWFRAVSELGPELATVAFAVLASLPKEHFRTGPGAYFAGMVKAHRAGKLNIIGSFHGMRERAEQGLSPTQPPERATKVGRSR